MGRIAAILAVGLALVMTVVASASAETRMALVIGNSNYAHGGKLSNPVNDAALVAEALRQSGFTVISKSDLGRNDLADALKSFARETGAADTAVVYYSGHGMEVGGINYLIPVDALLASDTDIEFEAVPLDLVMTSVGRARRLKVVILDACRNNPFFDIMRRSNGQKAISIGLARPSASESGMLIAYAAREGTTAANGTGRNSPYAMALATHIVEPGLDVRRLFGKVHDDVLKLTGGNQEPRNYDSLGGDDYFLTPPNVAPPLPPVPAPPLAVAAMPLPSAAPDAKTIEMKYWDTVDIHEPDQLRAYLNQYPKGSFANLARAKLAAGASTTRTSSKAVETTASTVDPAVAVAAEPPNSPARKSTSGGDAKPAELASIAPPNAVPLVPAPSAAPTAMTPLPPRPTLTPVPAVQLPASFCSAKERNRFHSETYAPANQIAHHNNELAIGYLEQIGKTQRQYASAGSGFANVVTREFLDFKPTADIAFAQSEAYAKMFDAVMAVPITPCH